MQIVKFLQPVKPAAPSALPSSSSQTAATTPAPQQLEEDLKSLPEMSEQAVLSRICALRAAGKWSLTRLPLCLDAPRRKCHFDYLLEEVRMMSVDFRQERFLKMAIAKMVG